MKAKLNIKRVVICLIIFLGIIAGITCLIIKNKGNNPDKKNNSSTSYIDSSQRGKYIEILTDDCSLYIGTSITLKCEANPETALHDLSWTSSDEEIVIIDDNGKLTVVGSGTSIITATNGTLTDSIIIIGIEKEQPTVEGETVTEPMLPIYVPNEKGELVPDKPTEQQTESNPVEPVTDVTKETEEESYTQGNTENKTEPATQKNTDTETEPVTSEENINYPERIIGTITSLGYTKYKEDYIYIYEEDGNYLGEVIVNDTFIQIYIQTRTTQFDKALKALIGLVIPDEYEKVYSAFVSAEDNKTIKVQNHIIRIRPGSGENHAQLIISY